MPSLRRSYWFYFPSIAEDSVSLKNEPVLKRLSLWVLSLLCCSLFIWLWFDCVWYLVFRLFPHAFFHYRLYLLTTLYSSLYGLMFAFTLSLITITRASKKFIASRMFLAWLLYFSVNVPVTIAYFQRMSDQGKRISHQRGWLCRLIHPLKCGVLQMHITLEWGLYPSLLLLVTYALIWFDRSVCSALRCCCIVVSSMELDEPTPLNQIPSMIESSQSKRMNFSDSSTLKPNENSIVSDSHPPSQFSFETDSLPTMKTSPSRISSNLFSDIIAGRRSAWSCRRRSTYFKSTPPASEVASSVNTHCNQTKLRRSLVGYCVSLAIALTVWVNFSDIRDSKLANRHFDAITLAFFISYAVLNVPLNWFSAQIDFYRLGFEESMNDVSLEIINAWITSLAYYSFLYTRLIWNGTEKTRTKPIVVSLLLSEGVHIIVESFRTFIQPLQGYFSMMKNIRSMLKDCLIINDLISNKMPLNHDDRKQQLLLYDTEDNDATNHHLNSNGCLSCVKKNLAIMLFDMLDLYYLKEFTIESNFGEWRNRCFISSQLRLFASVITGVMSWIQAFEVYAIQFRLDPDYTKYRWQSLNHSLHLLLFQIIVNLLIFISTHVWFSYRYRYTSYNAIFCLAQKTKNPRYLFTLMVSIAAYIQIALFQ